MADNNVISDELYAQTVFEDGGSLVVDLSNIQEMKFEVIPKGIYDAEVDSVEYQISKNSGAPMFQFVFSIDGGDYAGRKLYHYTSFSPKALPSTKTQLLRIDPEIFNGPFKPQEVAESGQLLGKKVRIKVTHQEYNGEPQARIAQILAPAAGGSVTGDGFFGG